MGANNLKMAEAMLELLERNRRIETRLVQLGDHVGANLREKQRITIIGMGTPNLMVEVDSAEVSIARILVELDDANGRRAVGVGWDHQIARVMQLLPGDKLTYLCDLAWTPKAR